MGWHVGWRLPEAGSSGWVRWRLHKPYADGEIDRGVFGLVGESWRVVEGYGGLWSHFEWFGKEKRVIVHTCAHMCMHECTQVFKWEGANGCRWVVEFIGIRKWSFGELETNRTLMVYIRVGSAKCKTRFPKVVKSDVHSLSGSERSRNFEK